MLFVIQFVDVYGDHPELLPQRDKLMAAHLAYLAEHNENLIAAGALRASPFARQYPYWWALDRQRR